MFRFALKSVRHNPKRLILTAFAVALGVSLVAATFTFTNALSSGFSGLFDEIYGGTDVIVEAVPGDEEDDPFAPVESVFSEADVAAVEAVDGVTAAVGGIQVAGTILPADGPSDNPGFGGPPTQLYNWSGNAELSGVTIEDGRAPEADGEIVIDIDGAPALGYEIGDTVSMSTDLGVEEFELVGTIKFGESNELQGATLALMTTADAHRIMETDGYGEIAVAVEDGAESSAVAEAIQPVLPEGTRAISGTDKAAEASAELDEFLQYIDVFAIAFALISLFVGAYIIVNTFRIIVTQRTREFGLMRAIGVTGQQVRSMILLEAVVVGVIASTIGIVIGYLLALGFAGFVSVFAGDIFGALVLPLDAVLWSYVLGMIVTMIAALLPAIHASRISPMEALRESATSGKKPLKVRNIVGGALLLVGIIATGVGLFAGVERPYIYVGAGAVLLVLGATLLAAQVLVPMAYGLRSLLTRMFRVDGKLAANNIRREPRRSANTAAALMIGVMLLALVATFTESLKSVITEQFQQTNADFFVIPAQGTVPQGAVDVIASQDGVDVVATIGFTSVDYEGDSYATAALDPESTSQAIEFDTDPDLADLDSGTFVGPGIQAMGVEVGDTVTLSGPDGEAQLEVTGRYLTDGDAAFILDVETATSLVGEVPILQAMVVLDDEVDVEVAQTDIEDALAADYPLITLQAPSDLEQFVNQIVDLILGVISALLGTALLIALLGVANTLLLSVTERTREIGLLRAVGLKRRSVWRMITVESMVMALFGTILGMILGVSLGSALVIALEDFGFDGVTVPWLWLILYTVLAAIAGVLAAIWPAWRASRLNILEAIAADG